MRSILIYLFACIGFTAGAQELLTVEEAVAIALKNNYEIRIAANELKIDEQNVSLANAGLLPSLSGTFTQDNQIQNSRQVRSDGTVQELDNALNNRMEYGINLGWTIFDGFGMFARYDQLKEFEDLGETELKLTVLNRVSDVMTTYFDIVQQQQVLKALDTAIVISNERVETAQNRFTIGKAAKLEVLNAQVDLNTDQTNFLRQKEQYQNTKTYLNELMARKLDTDFVVADSVIIDDRLKLVDLMSLADSQNPEIKIALINKRIAELNLKQVRANRYPQINVNTGYVITDAESSLGFARENYGRGFSYGVGASINIFNGFLQNRNEKIAKLQIDNSQLQIEQQKQTVNSQLMTAFQTYLTNLELVELEARNVEIAEENLDITMAKFRIGTITTLEVRTAQLNYINAMARNSSAQFQAKMSEVRLKELAGNIELE
ncbi:TolC family protein [Flavobacterium coralii]|uniref:TolC family protein n=1 Tax=Flavobacterium coralii TaxID=2838017 RepID=UPI000C58B549|nr:transporter [Flavobacterium sp.]|tara:strand:- start:6127 stop:7428 length:1302 start_codon:yes stop_codon:yes gene_type:complete